MIVRKPFFLASFGRKSNSFSDTDIKQFTKTGLKMKNRKHLLKRRQKHNRLNPLTRRVVGGERLEGRKMFSVDLMPAAEIVTVPTPPACNPAFVHEFADGSAAATADCKPLPSWWPNEHDPSLNQHNAKQPTDVNGDGLTTPLDALLVLNRLNSNGPHKVPHLMTADIKSPGQFRLYDTNADGYVTSDDFLTVIHALNNPEDPSAPNVEPDAAWAGELVPLPLPPRTCMVPFGCNTLFPPFDNNAMTHEPVFADDSEGEFLTMNENTKAATFHQAPVAEKSSTEDYFAQLGNSTLDPMDTGIFADTDLLSSLQ